MNVYLNIMCLIECAYPISLSFFWSFISKWLRFLRHLCAGAKIVAYDVKTDGTIIASWKLPNALGTAVLRGSRVEIFEAFGRHKNRKIDDHFIGREADGCARVLELLRYILLTSNVNSEYPISSCVYLQSTYNVGNLTLVNLPGQDVLVIK